MVGAEGGDAHALDHEGEAGDEPGIEVEGHGAGEAQASQHRGDDAGDLEGVAGGTVQGGAEVAAKLREQGMAPRHVDRAGQGERLAGFLECLDGLASGDGAADVEAQGRGVVEKPDQGEDAV